MPHVNIDFYTPRDAAGAYTDLRAALIAASAYPAANRLRYRNPMYNDFFEGVEELSDGTVIGTVARVRMRGLPGKFHGADFHLADLDLEVSDGVAEEVHFLISDELQTLAIQRNGGFRSTQVESLLVELSGIPMALEPKVRTDQLQRLQSFEEFSQVGFKLNDPSQRPDFTDSLPSVARTIDDAAQIGELASIELVIRMRIGESNPQDTGVLRRLITSLTNTTGATKLFANGRPAKQKIEHIDLLRDRIVSTGEIEYGDGRRLDGVQCRQLLRTALFTNQQFLQNLMEERGQP